MKTNISKLFKNSPGSRQVVPLIGIYSQFYAGAYCLSDSANSGYVGFSIITHFNFNAFKTICDILAGKNYGVFDAAYADRMVRVVSNKTISLNFNFKSKGPLGNKLVRQAIAYAVDRKEIVDGVLNAIGSVAYLPVPPNAFGFDPQYRSYEFSLEKAKLLMKKAGYEKGFSCSVWIDDNQVFTEIATVLQNQLQKLGINLKIEVMKQATKLDRLYKHQEFDMNMSYFNCNIGDGDYNLYSTFSPQSSSNLCSYNSVPFTALLDKSRATYDDAARKVLYHQMYQILDEDMPALPIYYEEICIGTSKKVQNFTPSRIGATRYNAVTLAK